MTRLPDEFLNYAYFWRKKWAKGMESMGKDVDRSKFLVDATRILPAVSIAQQNDDGTITTNSKIIGCGFVLKREFLDEATKVFKEHIVREGMDASSTTPFGRHEKATKEDKEKLREFQSKSLKLFQKKLYFEKEEAEKMMDFTKLCTIELGNQYPNRPAHMWNFAQNNKKATLLYFTPPVLSYEIWCNVEIHTEGPYFEFIHAVHDAYFGEDPSEINLPAYIFNVEEVFNNSASPKGFGMKMA